MFSCNKRAHAVVCYFHAHSVAVTIVLEISNDKRFCCVKGHIADKELSDNKVSFFKAPKDVVILTNLQKVIQGRQKELFPEARVLVKNNSMSGILLYPNLRLAC